MQEELEKETSRDEGINEVKNEIVDRLVSLEEDLFCSPKPMQPTLKLLPTKEEIKEEKEAVFPCIISDEEYIKQLV